LHGASAAIEFGVCGLGVRHIVVLGHGLCGGIRAALHGGDLGEPGPSFIDDWMGIIAEARDAVVADPGDNPQLKLEHEAIKVSLANLLTFPFIKRRVDAGELKLHGAWFAIGEGRLYILNDATGAFESVE
jgi:carbonic anhydrase